MNEHKVIVKAELVLTWDFAPFARYRSCCVKEFCFPFVVRQLSIIIHEGSDFRR
jgi:hypothetical protein